MLGNMRLAFTAVLLLFEVGSALVQAQDAHHGICIDVCVSTITVGFSCCDQFRTGLPGKCGPPGPNLTPPHAEGYGCVPFDTPSSGDMDTPSPVVTKTANSGTLEAPSPGVMVTFSPTALETASPTATETPSPTAMETSSPTAMETPSPTAMETPSPTAMETPSPTAMETSSPTAMETPSPTAMETPSPTAIETPSPTSMETPSPIEDDDDSDLVEVGTQTNVTVTASAYDTRPGEDSGGVGCGDDGCKPSLTRDGITEDDESRWSCSKDIVPDVGQCEIEFTFGSPQYLVDIEVAFWKADEFTRSLKVKINGEEFGTFESSPVCTFNSFGVEEDNVTDVILESVGISPVEYINLLEVRFMVEPSVSLPW